MSIRKSRETIASKLFRILNSMLAFCVAFMVCNYLFWIATGLMAKFLRFHPNVYYFGIRYLPGSETWGKFNITFVYAIGPVMMILLGLLALFIWDKTKNRIHVLNLFLLWMFVVGGCMFVAHSIVAALGYGRYPDPYYQNLAVVYEWWRIPQVLVYVAIGPFALVLIYLSVNFARPFISLAYSYTKVNKLSRRRKFFFETAMVPFAIGSLVVAYVTWPLNVEITAVYLLTISGALVITWWALFWVDINTDDVLRYESLQEISYPLIGLFLFIFGLVYATYSHGFNL